MKTRNSTTTTARGASRPPLLGNERGMLLVITMIVLLVISTLAAANLINAFLERSIAKNQNYASVALNAADAGIDAGIAWLGDPGNRLLTGAARIPVTGVAWTREYDPMIRNLANGGRYEVTITTKFDDQDRDKDCPTSGTTPACTTNDFVLYNKVVPLASQGDPANNGKFNYEDAKETVAGQGFPVMTITSKGSSTSAPGNREIRVDIARIADIPPGVRGAISSKDPVDFGDSNAQAKDGRAHAIDGSLCSDPLASPPCDCSNSTNGLFVENGTLATSDVGNADTVYPAVTGGITENPDLTNPLCATAECALGYKDTAGVPQRSLLEAAALANGRIFGPGAGETPINDAVISSALETLPAGAIVIVKGNFTMTAGTTVGINHAKRLVVDGTFDALGNTLFTGLVVAKHFDTCGNLVVNGAVVATGDSNAATKPFANGVVWLQYSCDALAAAVGQVGYTVRLGWQRQY